MTTLTRTDTRVPKLHRMDRTHQEAGELLQALSAAIEHAPATVATRFAELLTHTEAHFAQEERWMADLGFAADNCHALQHAQVLQHLREVHCELQEDPETPQVHRMIGELSHWFNEHVRTVDAALAERMRACGYDADSRRMPQPALVPAFPLTGCGARGCH